MINKKLSTDDKKAIDFWELYYANLQRTDAVDLSENELQKKERIKGLEANPEAWFKFY